MRSKIIVSKFGGTSMGDAQCMLRSAEVATERKSAVVVVSATSGTTNTLIELAKAALSREKQQTEQLYEKIFARHQKIALDLGASEDTQKHLNSLLHELKQVSENTQNDDPIRHLDLVMSFGELLSSVLFVEALKTAHSQNKENNKVIWLDAREIMSTDSKFGSAIPLTEKIKSNCQKYKMTCKSEPVVYITQGFIGRDENSCTTTLGRGGSDYSAALLAEGLSADVLEIWTDVPGIATTDPRIVSEAKYIETLTYAEAAELAAFGAKVLHPATIYPAVRQLIPVFVGSSFDPNQKGTWIYHETPERPLVRGMAIRKKQALVTISSPYMVQAHGFLYKLFKIFDDYKISIDAITTSETTVSVTLEESALSNSKLIKELELLAKVNIEEGLSLVALIGNKINETPGLVSKVFGLIPDINVRMICQGSSSHNLCFLVSDGQGQEVIKKLHQEFCS